MSSPEPPSGLGCCCHCDSRLTKGKPGPESHRDPRLSEPEHYPSHTRLVLRRQRSPQARNHPPPPAPLSSTPSAPRLDQDGRAGSWSALLRRADSIRWEGGTLQRKSASWVGACAPSAQRHPCDGAALTCPGRQPPSPAPTLRHGRKGDFQRPLPAAPESTPLANGLTLAVVGMPSPLGFCSSFLATVAFSSSDLSGSPLSWKTKQSQSGGPAPPWKRTSTFWGPLSLRAPSPTPPRARGGGRSVGAGAAQAERVLPPR